MIEFEKIFKEIDELEALIRKTELINDNHSEFAKRMFQYCIDLRHHRMEPFFSRTVH
jgi:hypothetical protein